MMSKEEEDEISILSRPIIPPWATKPETKKEDTLFCPWEYPDAQPPPPPPQYANWSPVSPRKAAKPAGLTAPAGVGIPKPVHFNRPSSNSPQSHRRVLFRPEVHRRSHSEGRKPLSNHSNGSTELSDSVVEPKSSSLAKVISHPQKVTQLQISLAMQSPKNKDGHDANGEAELPRNSNDSGHSANDAPCVHCPSPKIESSSPLVTGEESEISNHKTKPMDVKLQSKRVSRKKNQSPTPIHDQSSTEGVRPPWRRNDSNSVKQPIVSEILKQPSSSHNGEGHQVSSLNCEATGDSSETTTAMVSVNSQSVQTQQASFLQQHHRAQQTRQQQQQQQQQQPQGPATKAETSQAQQQSAHKEVPWRSPRASRKELGKPPSAPKEQQQTQPSWRGTAFQPKQPQSTPEQVKPATTVPIGSTYSTSTATDSSSKSAINEPATSYVSTVSLTTVTKVESKISEVKEQSVTESLTSSESSQATQSLAIIDSSVQNKDTTQMPAEPTPPVVPTPPPPPPGHGSIAISSSNISSTAVESVSKITTAEPDNICLAKATESEKQTVVASDEVLESSTDSQKLETCSKEEKCQEIAEVKAEEKSSVVAHEREIVETISEVTSTNETVSMSEKESTVKAEASLQPPPPPPLPSFPLPQVPLETVPSRRAPSQEDLLQHCPPPPPASTPSSTTLIHGSNEALQHESAAEGEVKEFSNEPITTRIQKFEKQSSFELDKSQKAPPPARPVGPWVKRTSSGLVSQEFEPNKYSTRNDYLPFVTPERQLIGDPAVTSVLGGQKDQVVSSEEAKMSSARISCTQQLQSLSQQNLHQHVQQPNPKTIKTRSQTSGNLAHSYVQHTGMTADMPPSPSPATAEPPPPVKSGDPLFDPWCDPANPRMIQFQDVSAAAFKIKSGIMNTPCTRSNMSNLVKSELFFKKEFNQYTGSFKERGARYTLLCLSEEQRQKGVIAASAGNHALALSYHGQSLGIPVTVVMPLVAPIMKVQACRQYGANVLVTGQDISECKEVALQMARDRDLYYINGYDHPHILAGQGTIGLEIVEQVNNIDAVVVPVGGGGLIAGMALAVKSLYPHIKVIGVESEQCPSFSEALKAGHPVYTKAESSLADGLAVPQVGVNAFATSKNLVDKIVTVREEWIAIAILRLVEMEKAVVEGAGATALAALLAGELPELEGKRVVIPLCGGNIDTTVLGRCLERGLAADGRLVKFTAKVSDRPGGIAELTRFLANLGVSIKDMMHERAWIKSDIFSVEVKVVCETRDYDHLLELKAALEERYQDVRLNMPEIVT